ncbi:uncharacterized membrane protein HdeD (DUF308 family) [Catalinimonas alkaloidigena]|uniref:HdeD family acid-resistance protein n=1 Tax=Catalinimonas alkaloidigena TaxID=1075417 RepID=UPI002405FD7A|nr:DUF308 domain-containing protein [Catalinimonas alkaloidigena]MDF9796505.1 uncharacterized membrane protein HdeD (DUF308 family) [Catalinimonas alkaloidigena]
MTLERQFIKNKSGLIYRGVGAITFGLVALRYPGDEIYALAFPFGVLLLISGLINIIRYLSLRINKSASIFSPIGKGAIEVIIGSISLFTAVVQINLLWELIAFWIITTGVFQILIFSRIKHIIKEWKVMVGLGNLAVIFGASMLANNSLNMIVPTYELAIFTIFYGLCFIYIYFRLQEKSKYLRDKPVKFIEYKTKAFYEKMG